MTQLTIVDGTVPTPLQPEWDQQLRVCVSKLDPPGSGGRIAQRDAPSDAHLRAMKGRLDRIAVWMRPAPRLKAIEWLAAMLLPRAGTGDGEEGSEILLNLYAKTVEDLPAYAVREACLTIMHGEAPGIDRHFRPSSTAVRAEVLRLLQPLAKQQREIESVLNATVIGSKSGPEKRAAIVAAGREKVAEIAAEGIRAEQIRAGRILDDAPASPPETPQQTLDRLKSEPMPKASPALRRNLGIADWQENPPDWRDEERRAAP